MGVRRRRHGAPDAARATGSSRRHEYGGSPTPQRPDDLRSSAPAARAPAGAGQGSGGASGDRSHREAHRELSGAAALAGQYGLNSGAHELMPSTVTGFDFITWNYSQLRR